MKLIIIFSLLVTGFSNNAITQNCSLDASLSNIRSLLNEKSTAEKLKIEWLTNKRTLQINNHVFPVGENTHLKLGANNSVEFFLQKGTAITDVNDTTFRRASWQIKFASKTACKQFIKDFNCLKQF